MTPGGQLLHSKEGAENGGDEMLHYVILGCGPAARAGAAELRRLDPAARVTVVTRETAPFYLKPALAYGGPCFPRDTGAFIKTARVAGVVPSLAIATERVNQWQHMRLRDKVLDAVDEMGQPCVVAIMGLSYKAGTPVQEESAGIHLAHLLRELGLSVMVHDPMMEDATARLAGCLEEADVVVITTPWPEYREVDWSGKVLIDPTGIKLDSVTTMQSEQGMFENMNSVAQNYIQQMGIKEKGFFGVMKRTLRVVEKVIPVNQHLYVLGEAVDDNYYRGYQRDPLISPYTIKKTKGITILSFKSEKELASSKKTLWLLMYILAGISAMAGVVGMIFITVG